MKILITLLITFSFLSCKKNSNKADSADNNSIENDQIFTITHKADNDEDVIIYLYKNTDKKPYHHELSFDIDSSPYKLQPKECLKLTANQFNELIVYVGISNPIMALYNQRVCYRKLTKCAPGNYEIFNYEAWWGTMDNYVMNQANSPNTSDLCVGIEQWMKQKAQEQ